MNTHSHLLIVFEQVCAIETSCWANLFLLGSRRFAYLWIFFIPCICMHVSLNVHRGIKLEFLMIALEFYNPATCFFVLSTWPAYIAKPWNILIASFGNTPWHLLRYSSFEIMSQFTSENWEKKTRCDWKLKTMIGQDIKMHKIPICSCLIVNTRKKTNFMLCMHLKWSEHELFILNTRNSNFIHSSYGS